MFPPACNKCIPDIICLVPDLHLNCILKKSHNIYGLLNRCSWGLLPDTSPYLVIHQGLEYHPPLWG